MASKGDNVAKTPMCSGIRKVDKDQFDALQHKAALPKSKVKTDNNSESFSPPKSKAQSPPFGFSVRARDEPHSHVCRRIDANDCTGEDDDVNEDGFTDISSDTLEGDDDGVLTPEEEDDRVGEDDKEHAPPPARRDSKLTWLLRGMKVL